MMVASDVSSFLKGSSTGHILRPPTAISIG
jgi:hypothetical protein